jgi:hypothetical protein
MFATFSRPRWMPPWTDTRICRQIRQDGVLFCFFRWIKPSHHCVVSRPLKNRKVTAVHRNRCRIYSTRPDRGPGHGRNAQTGIEPEAWKPGDWPRLNGGNSGRCKPLEGLYGPPTATWQQTKTNRNWAAYWLKHETASDSIQNSRDRRWQRTSTLTLQSCLAAPIKHPRFTLHMPCGSSSACGCAKSIFI